MRGKFWLVSLILALLLIPAQAQDDAPPFYFGVDLSYVNEMDDCGAVYLEGGVQRDAYPLFAERGANLVRARLWHNPDWTAYSTLDDVMRTAARAHDAGMEWLLDIHYSDNWADPATQEIPKAWRGLSDEQLATAVYDYTHETLSTLHAEGLAPTFVQVGNETNGGILKRGSDQNWPRDAALFKAGIRAVRDFSAAFDLNIQIILHVAQPENTGWWFTEAEAQGLTDFDVIGISYYPQWSVFGIADMGATVSQLRERFGKAVMVVETAYPWTRDSANESASNILNQGARGYPVSPEGQRRFMTDLTQSLISNGALGIVYWEPAWVSTACLTRWGQGSHWENAAFFDFQNENEVLEGIDFLNAEYAYPDSLVAGVIDERYGAPLAQDGLADVLDGVTGLDLEALYATVTGDSLALAVTVAGDAAAPEGSYLVYIDTTDDASGAPTDPGRRPITAAAPYLPEYRLDISMQAERGTVSGRYTFNVWNGADWEQITFTGAALVHSGPQSVIALHIPLAALGNPAFVNLAVISTSRGRAQTAGDILGSDFTPADWSAPLMLDTFHHYDLTRD